MFPTRLVAALTAALKSFYARLSAEDGRLTAISEKIDRLPAIIVAQAASVQKSLASMDRTIMSKIDDLNAANAAEADAVKAELAKVLTLSQANAAGLAQIASLQASAGPDDSAAIASVVADMQARTKAMTDSLSTLSGTPATPVPSAPVAADSVTAGVSTDTIVPAAGTDSVAS